MAARPDASKRKLAGSGTASCVRVVWEEKFVGVVELSRFTASVIAKPSVVSEVRTGTVPAGLENMLKAKALPDVEAPSGEFTAGP